MKKINNKGITLVELIVSFAIVGVAVVYFYQTVSTVSKLYKASRDDTNEYAHATYVLRLMDSYCNSTNGDNCSDVDLAIDFCKKLDSYCKLEIDGDGFTLNGNNYVKYSLSLNNNNNKTYNFLAKTGNTLVQGDPGKIEVPEEGTGDGTEVPEEPGEPVVPVNPDTKHYVVNYIYNGRTYKEETVVESPESYNALALAIDDDELNQNRFIKAVKGKSNDVGMIEYLIGFKHTISSTEFSYGSGINKDFIERYGVEGVDSNNYPLYTLELEPVTGNLFDSKFLYEVLKDGEEWAVKFYENNITNTQTRDVTFKAPVNIGVIIVGGGAGGVTPTGKNGGAGGGGGQINKEITSFDVNQGDIIQITIGNGGGVGKSGGRSGFNETYANGGKVSGGGQGGKGGTTKPSLSENPGCGLKDYNGNTNYTNNKYYGIYYGLGGRGGVGYKGYEHWTGFYNENNGTSTCVITTGGAGGTSASPTGKPGTSGTGSGGGGGAGYNSKKYQGAGGGSGTVIIYNN